MSRCFCLFSGRDGASAYQWQRIKHYDLWRRKGKAVRRQYGKRKLLMIAAGSLLTGGAVAVSGTIGFVGLVIPHVTRLLWGTDHRHLLPLSALTGAGFLILADLFSRTVIEPVELPIGIMTALAGAPVFALILLRQHHGGNRL